MAEQLRRVAVWSGRLRLAHWLMAAATLVLMVTGWLIGAAPSLAQAASDLHYLAASMLLVALAIRLWLGFAGEGPERFEHLWPTDGEWAAVRGSLVFYLTLGKTPLPNWYAHNPLWKPLYLGLLLLLVLAAITGWLMPETPLIGRVYLPTVHDGIADTTTVWVVLHLLSVALQDVRGQNADTSAMLSGYRFFRIDRDRLVKPELPEVSVRIDQIRKR